MNSSIQQKLSEVERSIKTSGEIAFGRECANEYIVQLFRVNPQYPNYVNRKFKYYLDKHSNEIYNQKMQKLKHKDVKTFIQKDAYELLTSGGYEIVDFEVAS